MNMRNTDLSNNPKMMFPTAVWAPYTLTYLETEVNGGFVGQSFMVTLLLDSINN